MDPVDMKRKAVNARRRELRGIKKEKEKRAAKRKAKKAEKAEKAERRAARKAKKAEKSAEVEELVEKPVKKKREGGDELVEQPVKRPRKPLTTEQRAAKSLSDQARRLRKNAEKAEILQEELEQAIEDKELQIPFDPSPELRAALCSLLKICLPAVWLVSAEIPECELNMSLWQEWEATKHRKGVHAMLSQLHTETQLPGTLVPGRTRLRALSESPEPPERVESEDVTTASPVYDPMSMSALDNPMSISALDNPIAVEVDWWPCEAPVGNPVGGEGYSTLGWPCEAPVQVKKTGAIVSFLGTHVRFESDDEDLPDPAVVTPHGASPPARVSGEGAAALQARRKRIPEDSDEP